MGAPLALSAPTRGNHFHTQTRAEHERGYNNKPDYHLDGVLERHLADHLDRITRSFMRGQPLEQPGFGGKLKLFGSELR